MLCRWLRAPACWQGIIPHSEGGALVFAIPLPLPKPEGLGQDARLGPRCGKPPPLVLGQRQRPSVRHPLYSRGMPKKVSDSQKTRSTALARAEHGEPPVRLTAEQRTLLNEALRRGEDLREEIENHVLSYGRWLMGAV